MESISQELSRAVGELLGRASGPMHLRLLIQPTIASILAVRAGLRDAREGRTPFLWAWASKPDERKQLASSAWKDLGKVLIMAMVLDTIYQIIALKTFHILQTLIVATVVAVLPYIILRGTVTRIARRTRGAGHSPVAR